MYICVSHDIYCIGNSQKLLGARSLRNQLVLITANRRRTVESWAEGCTGSIESFSSPSFYGAYHHVAGTSSLHILTDRGLVLVCGGDAHGCSQCPPCASSR